MKKIILIAALSLFSVVAKAQSAMDFTFVNQTGEILWGLYVSETMNLEWGEDLLPSEVIGDGEEVKITFSPSSTECEWDIKLNKDLSGEKFVTVSDVNLCSIMRLIIYKTRSGGYEYRTE